MRAADLQRPGAAEQSSTAYRDWLLVASRSGRLQLSPGNGGGTQSAEALGRPEVARHGQCSALFDGLLYNRTEIERRLRVEGATDSELALRAYLRWGEGALRELEGSYALVVADGAEERVICARDRLGLHPLFYADADAEILLSTSITDLLGAPRVSGEMNRAALADHLAHRWPDPGETYFSSIRRVPAGHALVIEHGGRRTSRYWSPAANGDEIDWASEDELGQFEELFDEAVARFTALGPAGIFLSGGLDSVSVAAIAATTTRGTGLPAPLALSLGFSHPEANEQSLQRRVAADLGLPQLLVPLEEAAGPEGLMAASLELTGRWPAPLVNMWLPAYHYLAAQGRQRDCRVILTGHGGDEWLSVTPYYAADLLLRLDLKGLYRLWNNHQRSYPIPKWTILRNLLWRFGARPLLGAAAERIAPRSAASARRRRIVRATPRWLAPDSELSQELADRARGSVSDRPKPGQVYQFEMNRALDHPLVAMELEESFESGRQLGLRFGHPFWDADLLTFLYRTPPELLNQGNRSKGLVRAMLARRFPDLGFERHRKVSGTPVVREILTREGEAAWRRMGGATTLAELGVVDEGAVSAMIEASIAEGRRQAPEENAHAYRLSDILALEAWARAHS